MKKETKNNIIKFIISVLIICAIIYGAYYFIIGKDGLINQINTVENEFDKTEVLEELNELVKEKYMAMYNETKQDTSKKLDELYNADVAISYLVEKGVLEYYYYTNFDEQNKEYTYIEKDIKEDTPKRNDLFYVNVKKIKDVSTYGKGKKYNNNKLNQNDVFILEKNVENDITTYKINYFNQEGKKENVGVIELATPLIK